MIEYERFISYLSNLSHPTFECNGKHYQWPLDGMRHFDSFLDNPSQKLKVIHIAGTNGKGSCSSFIASILISMGLKVGTYNSPQLYDIRERIKINGKMISKSDVCRFYKRIKEYTKQNLSVNSKQKRITSYSEIFVEMAFDYFLYKNVDIAVIETGIGGRLDPTNIVKQPLICVITSIGKDHTELFGDNIKNIVMEKCGIMKKNVPIVIGHMPDTIKSIITWEAKNKHCKAFFTDEFYSYLPKDLKIEHDSTFDLKGNYQIQNIRTVLCTFHLLTEIHPKLFPPFQSNIISMALHNAAKITKLRGRWEIIHMFPTIIADICSNPFGLKINIAQLSKMLVTENYKRLVFILGLTSIKKISIKNFLPTDAWYIYTESRSFISAQELAEEIGIKGDVTNSVAQAISLYIKKSKSNDLVYIGGSIHVVAEALEILDKSHTLI